MPSRWVPPDDDEYHRSGTLGLGKEARVIVGLSLALFCALWALSAVRGHTQARLNGETELGIQVVDVNLNDIGSEQVYEETEVEPEPIMDTESINAQRLSALAAETGGDLQSAVDILMSITADSGAVIDDFLMLARAQEELGNLQAAGETLNRACIRYPDRPEGYAAIGAFREREGNTTAARFQYQIGLSYCPGDENLLEGLSRVERVLDVDDEPVELPVLNEPEQIDEITEIIEPETVGGSPISEPEEILSSDEMESSPGESSDMQTTEETDNPDDSELISLIGPEESDSEIIIMDSEDSTEPVIAEILDLYVNAEQDCVTIKIITDQPVAFSTSRGIEAPRLFIRIPDARIAVESNIVRSVVLNVPLVERINLVESTDSNMYVSLIVYINQDARYSVAADSRSVNITITEALVQERG